MGRIETSRYQFSEERLIRFNNFLTKYIRDEHGNQFALAKWQWKVLKDLLGTVDTETGRRRYTKWFCSIPRKNGKTSLSAILALYFLIADLEYSPEILFCACSREQAAICYKMCVAFVERSPFLRKHIRNIPSKKELQCNLPRKGMMRVMSSDSASAHGWNPSLVVLDEVAMFSGSGMEELYDAMTTAQGARKQPLSIVISTVGSGTSSLFYRLYSEAEQVQNGQATDPFLYTTIRSAPKDADWTDPDVWAACNPGYGLYLQPSYFEAQCIEAKNRPDAQNRFRRFSLNQWTSSSSAFFAIHQWLELTEQDISIEDLYGEPIHLGIDLSESKDLTAIVGCVYRDGLYYLIPWLFTPEKGIDYHKKKDQQPYDEWVKKGHLIATPGAIVDQRFLFNYIRDEIAPNFAIKDLAVDVARGTQLWAELEDAGYPVSKYAQGFTYFKTSLPEFEGAFLNGELRHWNNPVLTWNMESVSIVRNSEDHIRPSKRASKSRIDGAVAAIMAWDKAHRWQLQLEAAAKKPPKPKRSTKIIWGK